jgi:hypothetical protein
MGLWLRASLPIPVPVPVSGFLLSSPQTPASSSNSYVSFVIWNISLIISIINHVSLIVLY